MKHAATDTVFSAQEWLRYTRHIQLGNFGVAGQQKLKQARVLIVGAGGLGCPTGLYLAAAGVGHITIVDGDSIDITNLQRQIAYSQDQVGQPKAQMLQQRLAGLNPDISVDALTQHLNTENVTELVKNADIVVDCTDNFATRYLINDACYLAKKPWVMASIGQFNGQCSLFTPDGPCFRCLFPEAPEGVADCNSGGVVGVLPGLLAMYQTNEVIKYLVGLATPLQGNLLLIDALGVTQQRFALQSNPGCKLCHPESGFEIQANQADYQFICGAPPVQVGEISVTAFNREREQSDFVVLDVRSQIERQGFHIGGLHLPLPELSERLNELEQSKQYLVYCQSGVRSAKACQQLHQAGIKALSLQGGLAGWLKALD